MARERRRRRRSWSAANPGNRAVRDELAAAALAAAAPALRASGPLLDAGCGTGWWLERLLGEGIPAGRLHGVDVDAERVAAARARAPGAEVVQADLRSLPYPDGRFAAAFLLTVLSSVGGREAVAGAVGETWRVLAPGGLLVMWEPRVPNPFNPATRLVRPRELEPVVGRPHSTTTLTVLPWLVRWLGGRTPAWYPRLARIGALRTHRLAAWER